MTARAAASEVTSFLSALSRLEGQEFQDKSGDDQALATYGLAPPLVQMKLFQEDVAVRQEHRVGEKMFVDYTGQTMDVYDLHTNQMREAQIFVAALGASNYTYAEATWFCIFVGPNQFIEK